MSSICLIAGVLVVNQVVRDWQTYRLTEAGTSVVRDYAAVMNTFQALVIERSPTNNLMTIVAPYPDEKVAALRTARVDADKAMAALKRQLSGSHGSYGEHDLSLLAQAEEKLAAARQAVDGVKDIADSTAQIAAGTKAFNQLFAAPTMAFQAILGDMQRDIALHDPDSVTLSDIARTTNEIRDGGGKLVGRLTGPMTGKRPFRSDESTPEDRDLGTFQGTVASVSLKVGMVPDNQALAAAFDLFQQRYIDGAGKEVEQQIDIAHGDAKYSMSRAQLSKDYVPAINTIFGVRDTALRLAQERAIARMAKAKQSLIVTSGFMVLIIGLVAAISIVFRQRLILPLVELTATIVRIAGGARDLVVPHAGRKDEIGEIAGALDNLLDKARHADRLTAEREAENHAKQARAEKLEQLASGFEAAVSRLIGSLADAARGMKSTASTMSSTAQQTTAQSSSVSAASEETSQNVQTVATATEQLSRSIEEIGQRVEQSTVVAARAVEDARHTDDIIRTLSERAQNIGQVINLISGIASQTNLLALNATIEAARAGEAGKGFAVVASEVKNLAGQTNKATEDIATQIGEIQSATTKAVEAIHGITATVDEINAISAAIAAAIEEQGAATREIARSVVEAARTTQDVSSNIAGVREAAMHTGAAATTVLDAADLLANQSTHLGAEVEGFVAAVKAA